MAGAKERLLLATNTLADTLQLLDNQLPDGLTKFILGFRIADDGAVDLTSVPDRFAYIDSMVENLQRRQNTGVSTIPRAFDCNVLEDILSMPLGEFNDEPFEVTLPEKIAKEYGLDPMQSGMSEKAFARFVQLYTLGKLQKNLDGPTPLPAAVLLTSSERSDYFSLNDMLRTPEENRSKYDLFDEWTYKETAYRTLVTLCSKRDIGPHINREVIEWIHKDKEFREILLADLRSEESEVRSMPLGVFSSIASDVRFYEAGDITPTRNKQWLNNMLVMYPELREAVKGALAKVGDRRPYKSLEELVSDESTTRVEELRRYSLAQMKDIHIILGDLPYKSYSLTRSALGKIAEGKITPLEAAKVVLLDSEDDMPSIYNNYYSADGRFRFILQTIVRNALETHPDIFEGHAQHLQAYFTTYEQIHREVLKRNQVQPSEVAKKMIAQGLPIIYQQAYTDNFELPQSYGDAFLSLPSLMELHEATRTTGNDITYIVRPGIGRMIETLLKSCPRIKVVEAPKSDEMVDFCSKLTPHDQNSAISFSFINSDVTQVQYEVFRSRALMLTDRIEEGTGEFFVKNGIYPLQFDRQFRIITDSVMDDNTVGLMGMLGLSSGKMETRENAREMGKNLSLYVQEYVRRHPEIEDKLLKINETAGFENGFIYYISDGSQITKHMTPGLNSFIAKHVAEFCRKNKIGIVFIHSNVNEPENEVEEIASFHEAGIPVQYLGVQKGQPIEETIALLTHETCRGGITPDSLLKHLVGLVKPSMPNFVISQDANIDYWAIPGTTNISAMHPMAIFAGRAGHQYALYEAEFMMGENKVAPAFPFENLFDLAESTINDLPPLLREFQEAFKNNLLNSMTVFKSLVLKSLQPNTRRSRQSKS